MQSSLSSEETTVPDYVRNSKVKFGLQFRNFPSTYGQSILTRMLEIAHRTEVLGFDSVWMIDHLEMKPPISYESQSVPECWTMICALATVTSIVKVGSLVTCTLFRNPNFLARLSETASDISSGRLIVGLGSGWFEQEFKDYGIDYPSPRERVIETRKTAVLIRNKTQIPVWIGGSGETLTLKIVARYADGCSLFGDIGSVRKKLEILDGYCRSIGRDPREITRSKHSNVLIGENSAEVRKKLSELVPDESKWRAFISSNIVGTPEECSEQINSYVRIGIDYMTLSFPDLFDLNCLEIFSNSVIREFSEKDFGVQPRPTQ